jgi:biotin carboxylase
VSERPFVALVYQRPSLPWMFRSAKAAGIDLVLVHRPNPLPDERLPDVLPDAVVETLPLDLNEGAKAVEKLAELHERRPLDGITTCYDAGVQWVAGAARALGLPGLSERSARAVRDKRAMRDAFAEAGLNSPRHVALATPAEWKKAADLAFPVVVKPADGFGSMGVSRVDDVSGLEQTVRHVWDIGRLHLSYDSAGRETAGLVVEEYLDGPEFCVESLAYRGEVRVYVIGYKGQPRGPYFEESVYRAPAQIPAGLEQKIIREVTRAHDALGITDGPTHTELRLRGDTPYLLETGARVGGSGISHYVAQQVTGVDYAAEAFRICAGRRPLHWDEPLTKRGFGANYAIPIGGSGIIRAMRGFDEVRADPRVDHVAQMLRPGDLVRPYPDQSGYPGFVLSRHESYADAERFHEWLNQVIQIDYDQPEPARGSEDAPAGA